MLWRNKKSEEDFEEKSKASGILKVSVVIFILVFVLLLIPEEWFEKKVEQLNETSSSSQSSAYTHNAVRVEDTPEGAIVNIDDLYGGKQLTKDQIAFLGEGSPYIQAIQFLGNIETRFEEVPEVNLEIVRTEESLEVLPNEYNSLFELINLNVSLNLRECLTVIDIYDGTYVIYAYNYNNTSKPCLVVYDESNNKYNENTVLTQLVNIGDIKTRALFKDYFVYEDCSDFEVIFVRGA